MKRKQKRYTLREAVTEALSWCRDDVRNRDDLLPSSQQLRARVRFLRRALERKS